MEAKMNIFNLTEEQMRSNMKANANAKYGRMVANTTHRCNHCGRNFKPIQSNAHYSTLFCCADCNDGRSVINSINWKSIMTQKLKR